MNLTRNLDTEHGPSFRFNAPAWAVALTLVIGVPVQRLLERLAELGLERVVLDSQVEAQLATITSLLLAAAIAGLTGGQAAQSQTWSQAKLSQEADHSELHLEDEHGSPQERDPEDGGWL